MLGNKFPKHVAHFNPFQYNSYRARLLEGIHSHKLLGLISFTAFLLLIQALIEICNQLVFCLPLFPWKLPHYPDVSCFVALTISLQVLFSCIFTITFYNSNLRCVIIFLRSVCSPLPLFWQAGRLCFSTVSLFHCSHSAGQLLYRHNLEGFLKKIHCKVVTVGECAHDMTIIVMDHYRQMP